jgi:hypothetical protein
MMQMLKDDYIYTYGSGPDWQIKIATPQGLIDNYFVESQRAAEMVWAQKQGKVYIMYSGGVDSEYTLKLFHSMGMKVTPVIVRLTPNYNDHDTEYAFKFCSSIGLTPLVIDIDFDHFVKSGQILDIAMSAELDIFQYPAILHAISQLNGTVLCSTGEPAVRLDTDTKKWNVIFNQYDYTFFSYFEKHSITGTPFFIAYTPEMLFSFILDPRVDDLVNDRIKGKLGHQSSKFIIYNRHSGFNLEERPKYTGYENIEKSKIFDHDNIRAIKEMKNKWGGEIQDEYSTFIGRLKEKIICLP